MRWKKEEKEEEKTAATKQNCRYILTVHISYAPIKPNKNTERISTHVSIIMKCKFIG